VLTSILTTIVLMTGAAATPSAEQLLWFRNGLVVAQAAQVLDAMRGADAFGLDAADYELSLPASEIATVLADRADGAAQRRFDTVLSQTTARFVKDLHSGRIDPRSVGFHLSPATGADFDVTRAVRELATSPDVASKLDAYEPRPIPYRRLKATLTRYRALSRDVASIQLAPLPARSIGAGSEYSGAPQLRRLLGALGDLSPPDITSGEESLSMDAPLRRSALSAQAWPRR
jgi:murein L,D-transpeptidase YcbB/YkuD